MKSFKLIFIFLACLLFGSSSFATLLTQPQQVIESTSNEMKQLMLSESHLIDSDPNYFYTLVDKVFTPYIDLDRISAMVLGRSWRQVSNNDRQAFKQEFKRMLVRSYATAFRSQSDWEISYLPSRPGNKPNDILVRTKVANSGQPLKIDYRMRNIGEGWKVYDVKIEGISLVTNYRSSFKKIIRTSGVRGLIDNLNETNDKKEMIDS
ncbi:MAG: ABC transporter substrate-binding protein [Gammaproteobacteria bacterium]|nr:ABC transporter substrate-binding protein [Gammaproteobacteria bacterium]NNJ90125.1 ABC transporter substrate-binding protein [Gammaproteobacteria bacterium]